MRPGAVMRRRSRARTSSQRAGKIPFPALRWHFPITRGSPSSSTSGPRGARPCREELPALDQLAKTHPEVAVVGVNYQDAVSGANELQRELGWTFPSIADPFGELANRLGLQGMPTTYFLDADHRVAGVIVGGADLAGFEKGVELIAGDG